MKNWKLPQQDRKRQHQLGRGKVLELRQNIAPAAGVR